MDCDQITDENLFRIRQKLNETKVKLWLSPYITDRDEINEKEIEILANSYSSQLSIPVDVCLECLHQLQQKALINLREKNHFQSTGVASLKVKVSSKEGSRNNVPIKIELFRDGKSLKEEISKEISVSVERLKLVYQGKILKDSDSLMVQGVKHGGNIMAMIVESNPEDLVRKDSTTELVDMTKADVSLLAGDEYGLLQVADQSGKSLKLPPNERKALLLAMTLHEKGRAAIKREDFTLALVLLLESEREFSVCDSNLLKNVDNYGLLNLDIVWCYLNLQSVTHLPDAEERLRKCESSFHQSYGTNFERLIALKGSAGNEKVLFVRLHLLQAIVKYHQNKIEEAKRLLEKVEQELKCLVVDEEKLSQLVEIGYDICEARLALRESMNDVDGAIQIIERKRNERELNEKKEREEMQLMREKSKLGKCKNGEWVEPQLYKSLISMGYSPQTAKWALAQTNNNLFNSVSLINEHPEHMPGSVNGLVQQILSMGFSPERAKRALANQNGDIDKAVAELVANQNNPPEDMESGSESEDTEGSEGTEMAEGTSGAGGTANVADTANTTGIADAVSTATTSLVAGVVRAVKKRKEAYSRVAEDIAESEEDYLDTTLIAESSFLQMYKDLLSKR